MKIKALVPFSNGTISMEQYEVREVEDSLGNELISAGVAVEIGGGGSGGGVLVVHKADGTLDKTWQEIIDAMTSNGAVMVTVHGTVVDSAMQIQNAFYDFEEPIPYIIEIGGLEYKSETADGYPAMQ